MIYWFIALFIYLFIYLCIYLVANEYDEFLVINKKWKYCEILNFNVHRSVCVIVITSNKVPIAHCRIFPASTKWSRNDQWWHLFVLLMRHIYIYSDVNICHICFSSSKSFTSLYALYVYMYHSKYKNVSSLINE